MALELTAADVERHALADAQRKYLDEQVPAFMKRTAKIDGAVAASPRIGFGTILGAIVLGNIITGILGGIAFSLLR